MASKKRKKSTKKIAAATPAREAARQKALLATDQRSAVSRRENILANTANARIRGHALGAHRAAQARRDAQQRGTKRPAKKR